MAYVVGSALLLLLPTGFIGPMFVVGGFVLVCVIGLHYLVWGRWMARLLNQDLLNQEIAGDSPTSPTHPPD